MQGRVLVVDDEPDMLSSCRKFLEREGYGEYAVIRDPQGGVVMLSDVTVVPEADETHGNFVWGELWTSDLDGSQIFYDACGLISWLVFVGKGDGIFSSSNFYGEVEGDTVLCCIDRGGVNLEFLSSVLDCEALGAGNCRRNVFIK